ncbi:hypothetical protein XPA_008444 [Xanthoria parietina]
MDTPSSLPFYLRLVRTAFLGIILIQIILMAIFIAVCCTHPELLADDGLYTYLWVLLIAIIDLASMLPLWFLLTWVLLCLYRRHPSWFPYLMALAEAVDSGEVETEGLEWVAGLERLESWHEGDRSLKKGEDLV